MPAKAKPAPEPTPIPLGTNALKVGAKMYNPVTTQYLWKVIDIEPEHQFPDGEVGLGVKVRNATNHAYVWIERDKMNKILVVQ